MDLIQLNERVSHLEEKVFHIEEREKNDTIKIEKLDNRLGTCEQVIHEMDKSLSVSMEQIKTIAEDLKQTSINFKEAVMRSNTAQAKDTEALKEKCYELDQKIEKVNAKLEKETIGKDAESWRSSKKQIWSWVLNVALALIATGLGLSHFL